MALTRILDRSARRGVVRRLALCAAMVAPVVGIGTATASSAALLDLTCTANIQLSFNPPLQAGSTSQVTGTGSAVGCVSLNGRYTSLHSATVDITGTATAASLPVNPCSLILKASFDNNAFVWNNGQSSVFNATLSTELSSGTVGLSAHVTHGPLAGDSSLAAPVGAVPNLDCLSGLTSLAVPASVVTFG